MEIENENINQNKWIRGASLPFNLDISNLIQTNNNQIVVAACSSLPYQSRDRFAGLWRLNISPTSKWNHFVRVVPGGVFPVISYDKNRNRILLYSYHDYGGTFGELKWFDIDKKNDIENDENDIENDENHAFGYRVKMVCAFNEVHLVARNENDKHIIWKTDENRFITGHEFPPCTDRTEGKLLFLKDINTLLFCRDNIWSYNMHENEPKWRCNKFKYWKDKSSDVWGCVTTPNQSHLLCLNSEADLYIYNLNTMKWKKSKIKIRIRGEIIIIDESKSTNGLNTGNKMNLLVWGMVRKYGLNLHIPSDLISILSNMHGKEIVHILNTHDHYSISFDYILDKSSVISI